MVRFRCVVFILVHALIFTGCGEDHLDRVRALQRQGDFRAALELLRPMVDEEPDDPELQYRYGVSLSATGSSTSALWSLRRAMRDPNWLIPAALQLASSLLASGDAEGAIETLDRLLEVDPDHLGARVLRIRALSMALTRNEEVLEEVDRVLALDPENVDAMARRVSALIALDRIDEATEAMTEIGGRVGDELVSDDNLRAWFCATNAIFTEERGERDRAAEQYDACVERHPTHGMVIENAVRFYNQSAQSERAYEILENAVALEPASLPLRIALARVASGRGDDEEAERVLKEYAEREIPGRAMLGWRALRAHYVEVGDFASARDAAKRTLEIAAEQGRPAPQLFFDYADALILAGNLDAALSVARDLSVDAHRKLIEGRVLLQKGDAAAALGRFDEANRLWPNNAVARYYAAVAAEQSGDFDRAIEEYRQSIRSQQGGTDARLRLSRIYLAEGRSEGAANLFMSALQKGAPLDLDSELIAIRLLAQTNRLGLLEARLRRLAAMPHAGAALAAAVESLAERAGAAAGVTFLEGVEGLDLTHLAVADTLRSLVRLSHEAGQPNLARQRVADARERHPDLAVFQEIEGLDLELRGDTAGARHAYLRATERDPGHALAWLGIGRLDAETDVDRALASFHRAIEAGADASDVNLAAAGALIAAQRLGEAEVRLESVLKDHPYDRQAAGMLLSIHFARDEVSDRSLDLARRVARFGGGADALEQLAEVYQRLGEADLATTTQQRARTLRAQESAAALESSSS